ncbi:MAG: methyltransferase [Rhodospirillaceae bacterium]
MKRAPALLTPVVMAYEKRLRRYGETAQGVFWKNDEWQFRRYEILSRIFDESAEAGGVTIHDFGCGYGALFDYLCELPVMTGSRYAGIDMSEAMLAAARKRVTDPRASFQRQLWATEPADYTIVSGTFNMLIDADAREWRDYVEVSLRRLWKTTRRGLAFNMLNALSEGKLAGLYYVPPENMLAFVRAEMDPEAELSIDTPLPDFTIFARRRE